MTAIAPYQYSFSEKELKELARLLCGGSYSCTICAELQHFQRFLTNYLNETMTVEEAMGFFDAE
ncbi:MAG: hypothetical protein ACTTH8_00780 [Treponema sp.]